MPKRTPAASRHIATLLTAALGLFCSTGAAQAADPPTCTSATPTPHTLGLRSLTGPDGADLELTVETRAGCSPVETLAELQVKIFADDGTLADVRNLRGIPAPDGTAVVTLGQLPRNRRVEVQALARTDTPARTYVLSGETTTRLRPDLVVEAVLAPPQTLVARPVDVMVVVRERNGDTAADAVVTLLWGQPTGRQATVSVPAGGETLVPFEDIALPDPSPTTVLATVADASPAETDTTNNAREANVDVTAHELARTDVLVPSLGGYGVQFNQHVYAPITNLEPSMFADLEDAVTALGPQFARIFYNENWEEDRTSPRYDPANLPSFIRTVELAQAAGATINITYQSAADARLRPREHMVRFAAVLEDLVRARGLTNVRWVTIQNEPNTPGANLTLDQWRQLYQELHDELVRRGLREHIRIMGGDLIESGGARDHEVWFRYMTTNMASIVDAYSEHVYWLYDDTARFQFRLRDIRKLVVDDNPPETRRPTYITEFAVRGYGTANAFLPDGTEMRRTTLAAFQQLWFNIASAQLGFTGTSKWDLYWGRYDLTANNQSYWMINPVGGGWEVFPSYHALRLLLQTTERGWQVVRTEPWSQDDWDPTVNDTKEQELATYLGPDGKLTVLGLDTNGSRLTGTAAEASRYSVGGLPANTRFSLVLWNAGGDGENSVAADVTTNAAGVARFAVPLHAAFALTTVPVS